MRNLAAMTRRGAILTTVGLPAARLAAQQNPASLDRLLSLYDFEADAHARIAHGAWERISGGAADEITLKWNREAYDHIRLKPRILVDVSKEETRTRRLRAGPPLPLVLAPTG